MKDKNSVVLWFGRTASEILKALEFYDNKLHTEQMKSKQIKMTREEAIKKVDISFVIALEALGLLKFEEKPKSRLVNIVVDLPFDAKIETLIAKMQRDGHVISLNPVRTEERE